MPEATALDPEDAKLVTLARAVRVRLGAAEGAAVRDETGRTYVAASVALASLSLTAAEAAVAAAVSSGASVLEGAAVVTDSPGEPRRDVAVLRELAGKGALLVVAGADGTVATSVPIGPA